MSWEIIALAIAWAGSIVAGLRRKTIFSQIDYSAEEDGPRFFWSAYAFQMLLLTGVTLFVVLR